MSDSIRRQPAISFNSKRVMSVETNSDKISKSIEVILAAVVVSLILMGVSDADDLLESGKEVVNDTFGQGSFISTSILIGEVFMGMFLYVKTKNILMLLGFVILVVYLNVAFGVIG
ncbi:hypothetical protein K5Y32_21935 [Pantoea sp. DY-15]|uniref:type IV conjugative transfer system pilin TraA n=1 Tax=Pantoea sp. DY-15 TaxID=2871489 RepID=UPI001C957A45|nr:type IV conjugative transfer system pilin TraA [Pantoea sp. DY-15]MBY4890603.1 hypothetical protein [Pantoea sp. DY-15]